MTSTVRILSMPLPSPIPEDCVRAVQAVRALVGALGRSARAVEQRTGLTNAQLFILKQIAGEGPLSVNELAARALTKQSTVSILTGRLERAGLIERTRSETDGRRTIISLTPTGRRTIRRAPEPPMTELISALCELPKRDIRALETGLEALLRELGVSDTTPAPLFESPPARTPSARRTRRRA